MAALLIRLRFFLILFVFCGRVGSLGAVGANGFFVVVVDVVVSVRWKTKSVRENYKSCA